MAPELWFSQYLHQNPPLNFDKFPLYFSNYYYSVKASSAAFCPCTRPSTDWAGGPLQV